MGSSVKEPTTRIEIQLGGGIQVTSATLSVYQIVSDYPETLCSQQIEGNTHSLAQTSNEGSLAYAVAQIHKIKSGSKNVDVEGIVQLVAAFNPADQKIILNEHSTVAAAYCFAQFLEVEADHHIVLSDPKGAAGIALKMAGNFVDTGSGEVSKVISSPPNGLQTNSLPLYNSLASIVNFAIAQPEIYEGFTHLLKANSLFEALHNLAIDPFQHAHEIYALCANSDQVFDPVLPSLRPPASKVPDQWSLAIKINSSGAENFLISGTGYLAFDQNDRAWISNNTRQGTPNSSTFVTVLEPDGSPADFSPLFGGGLIGGGIGITASNEGDRMYIGNFGWGPKEWNPEKGSISAFNVDGTAISNSEGFTNELSRAQGMAFDSKGHLWICSWGTQNPLAPATSKLNFPDENSKVVVYKNADPNDALVFEIPRPRSPFYGPFGIAIDDDDNCYIACQGDKNNRIRSTVLKLCIENDEIKEIARWTSDFIDRKDGKPTGNIGIESFKMAALGPQGHLFVGGIASNRIVRLDENLNFIGEITNKMHSPWGVTFDSDNVLYAANFAGEPDQETQDDVGEPGPLGVTIIKNGDQRTAQFLTLPTGGEEVTLANGIPLYGNGNSQATLHCFDPLMRMTSSRVDRAGNLWVCNNWKPLAINDFLWGNPGGDGVVIFVGIAAP